MRTGIVEFKKTLGGRGLYPTWFSSYLRTIQMVYVFEAEEVGYFGPPEWGRRLEIVDCFGQSRLGLECNIPKYTLTVL